MSELKSLTYVEIDLKRCSLTYGTAPCTAAIGVTGTKKCYNSPNTCQDAANFSAGILTLRFAVAANYLPINIQCIPNIKSVKTTPQVLAPGESMGDRESVSVVFDDLLSNDVGIDKYHAERGFDPYTRGTFWTKFVARWPYIQGSALRVIRGFVGDELEDMETRHYIIDSTSGLPGSNNQFSIVAKDYLKLLDGDKAVAPRASNGVLSASISEVAGSLTLEPAGIGNDEYPTEGIYSIGDEYGEFTRSGDSVTLTERNNPSEHEEGETFQLGLRFDSSTGSLGVSGEPSFAIDYLLDNYTEVDHAWTNLTEWQEETLTYIARLYTADIYKPTPVKTLVNEIISQVGLVFYSDVINQKIVLMALRNFAPVMTVDDSVSIKESLKVQERPEKRVSLVLTYFGMTNPIKDLTEESNYRVIAAKVDDNSVSVLENRIPSIKKIHSRWINVFNRPAAEALNDLIIARYRNAPRLFQFELPITESPIIGAGITIEGRNLVDDEGSATSTIAQIISLDKTEGRYSVVAEEMTFVQEPATDHVIVIDADTFNFNLRNVHDQIYAEAVSGDNVIVYINAGVKVGATKTSKIAFNVGNWATGVNFMIVNNGHIQGCGGAGGINNVDDTGKPGGTAFKTTVPITIDNTNGAIWGGGGGGAGFTIDFYGGGGGGGAGYLPGSQVNAGAPATTTTGGGGYAAAGNGGGPGQDGHDSSYGDQGGSAGTAINGDSFITFIDEGDIRGPRIN